jgi:DNA-directed RNA polymerase specialized sigma24 family protein
VTGVEGSNVRPSLTSTAEARRRRFEQIYAANHAAIAGYVLRRTDNPDDAADVTSQAPIGGALIRLPAW